MIWISTAFLCNRSAYGCIQLYLWIWQKRYFLSKLLQHSAQNGSLEVWKPQSSGSLVGMEQNIAKGISNNTS